jgi:hypothetical protein
MDSDTKQKIQVRRNHGAYGSNVFQSTRLRRIIQSSNEYDRFLLDYGFDFLPGISIILWFILLLTQTQ